MRCSDFLHPPGVYEDMDVLDGVRDGVKMFITSQGSITENFIKIRHQEPCQDFTYPPSPFWTLGGQRCS